MRSRATLKVLAVLLVACVIAAIAYFRSLPGRTSEARSERLENIKNWINEGRAQYATISFSAFDSAASVDEIRRTLGAASIDGAVSPYSGSVSLLLDAASEFIHYRFVNRSPEVYISWRADRGYSFVSFDTLKQVQLVDKIWEYVCDRPFAPELTVEQAFMSAWNCCRTFEGGGSIAVAFAGERNGLAVVLGELTLASPHERRPLKGELPWELWRGGVGGSYVNWFESGPSRRELLQRFGKIQYADVGMIIEFGGRVRIPIAMTFFWDPTTRRWRIEYLNAYNYPGKSPPAMVY